MVKNLRFHDITKRLLSSRGRIAVITTLVSSPKSTWNGSEMARAAGVTPRWAIETLRALEAEGVLHSEWSPPSWRWTLNRNHLLVDPLLQVAQLDEASRQALKDELRKVVAPLKPVAAIWFGSTVHGREAPMSDVDLLVVIPEPRRRAAVQETLSRCGSPFFWRFGNRLAPVVLTRAEFERGKRHGFVRAAIEGGVWIWGKRAVA